MSDQGILLFTNQTGSGSAGTSDFVKDEFVDTALPPSSNSGFTSTVSTNPLNEYFGNSVVPRWMAKTLWIKDLQLVEDKGLWINNKPTYKIIFTEDFPGVNAYCYGACSLNLTSEQRSLNLKGIGDAIGVGGVIRRVQWLVRPTTSTTATAALYLDGVTGSNIDFSTYTTESGLSASGINAIYHPYVSAASDETRNIHDYRLIANQQGNLVVHGIQVYFNISGSGLDLPGGDIYLDKTKLSPSGGSLAFPAGYSTFLGGKMGVYVDTAGALGLTSSFVPEFSAPCTGASGTNLLSVQAGLGGSFPQGTGVYVASGATHYLGMVTSQSGDVLTVSPTLAFGLSNICRSLFQTGHTFNLGASLWQESYNYSVGFNETTEQNGDFKRSAGLGSSPTNILQFSDPLLRYRVTGFTLSFNSATLFSSSLSGATYGIAFRTGIGSLSFEGKYTALDMELIVGSSSTFNATFLIDGVAVTSINENIAGPSIVRRRVLTNAGMGWHSIKLLPAAGMTQVMLTRFIAYEPKLFNGPTLGALAEIPIYQTLIMKNSAGASSTSFGNVQRLYADNIYFKPNGAAGSWQQGVGSGSTIAGGVVYQDIDGGDAFKFSYFGTQFAIIGANSASYAVTFDGSPLAGASFNQWLSTGATLGFHTVTVTDSTAGGGIAGGLAISAVDFFSPVSEVKSLVKFFPSNNQDKWMSFYNQASEPFSAKPGDVWQSGPLAYQRLLGAWQPINVNQPICIAKASGTQNFATGGTIPKSFNSAIYDPFGMINFVGSTFYFTIPQDGNYLIGGAIQWTANATGYREMSVESIDSDPVQGYLVSLVPAISGVAVNTAGSASVFNLKKGNRIIISAFQNSGATLSTTATADRTYAYLQRIGP